MIMRKTDIFLLKIIILNPLINILKQSKTIFSDLISIWKKVNLILFVEKNIKSSDILKTNDEKNLSLFLTYKNIKNLITDNFDLKNITQFSKNNNLYKYHSNKLNNNILTFTEEMTKNLFLNSVKITKIKNKYNATNYNFFEYFYKTHTDQLSNKNSNFNESNLVNPIIHNFLLTSFFCNETSKTKLLIEFLKLEIDQNLFTYNFKKEDYCFSKNLVKSHENDFENNSSSLDSLNLNLIFDITFVDQNKRNFSNCRIIDNFILLISQDEMILFPLNDIMSLNVNLNCFSFNLNENFNNKNNLSYLHKNIREIPQAYNWPVVNGLKPTIKTNSTKQGFIIEKKFVLLYYNRKKFLI